MKVNVVLIIILFVGLLLRVLFINSSPSSLYGDELTITLDAYSLLKTGHDQLGNFLPLTFPMGAGRPAGYVYGSIPFIALFGPTALGVRALSIISGMGILLLLYFFGKRFSSEKIGLLAAAVGAFSPWDIALSRGGFEAHFALFLALLGAYSYLKAKESPKFFILSALSFGLAIHTYPTYKISLLLFIPLLLWFQKPVSLIKNSKKYFLGSVIILLFLSLLSLSQTFFGGSETRFADINILSQGKLRDSIEQKINYERGLSNLPQILRISFHNKLFEYSKVFIENYSQNFSLNFLFLHGDQNPRHNMATMGGLYIVELLLIAVGFLTFWQKQRKLMIFLLLWIILAPIPAAIVDFPHALRSSLMLPPLILLSALGLGTILNERYKKVIYILVLIFIIQFVFFIQKVYFLAPNEYSSFWSYPAELATQIATQNNDKYNYIILSERINDVEFAYPVYTKLAAPVVISQNQKKTLLEGISFKKYGNIYIGSVPGLEIRNFLKGLQGSVLFIDAINMTDYLDNYKFAYGKDGLKALIISEILR